MQPGRRNRVLWVVAASVVLAWGSWGRAAPVVVYVAHAAKEPPKIDGRVDDACWRQAQVKTSARHWSNRCRCGYCHLFYPDVESAASRVAVSVFWPRRFSAVSADVPFQSQTSDLVKVWGNFSAFSLWMLWSLCSVDA